MKNWKYGDPNSGVTLALPVPEGAEVGNVVALGEDGLLGILMTDRATAGTVAAFTSAPGLAAGEASVRLIGIREVIEVETADQVAQFDVIETDGAGDGTYGATEGIPCGFALNATGASGGTFLLAVANLAIAGS